MLFRITVSLCGLLHFFLHVVSLVDATPFEHSTRSICIGTLMSSPVQISRLKTALRKFEHRASTGAGYPCFCMRKKSAKKSCEFFCRSRRKEKMPPGKAALWKAAIPAHGASWLQRTPECAIDTVVEGSKGPSGTTPPLDKSRTPGQDAGDSDEVVCAAWYTPSTH